MDPLRYTELATAASTRYSSVLTTYRGLLLAGMTRPYSSRQAQALRANAQDIGASYLVSEREHIDAAIQETATNALGRAYTDIFGHPPTRTGPSYDAFLEQSGAFLEGELASQTRRDVETLVKASRDFALESALGSRKGKNLRGSVSASGFSASDRLTFQFRDRGGRLHASHKFVRSAWRHTLLSLGADFYMIGATVAGAHRVELHHPDPTSPWEGYAIDLTTPEMFLDVREKALHPNSQVTMKAVN